METHIDPRIPLCPELKNDNPRRVMLNDDGTLKPCGISAAIASKYDTPQEKYLDFHKKLCDDSRDLSEKKQRDYTDLSSPELESVFGNFMGPEKRGIAKCDTVMLCRLDEKFTRLINCLKNGGCEVEDETLQDTLMDMLNFVCLIAYYQKLKSEKENE